MEIEEWRLANQSGKEEARLKKQIEKDGEGGRKHLNKKSSAKQLSTTKPLAFQMHDKLRKASLEKEESGPSKQTTKRRVEKMARKIPETEAGPEKPTLSEEKTADNLASTRGPLVKTKTHVRIENEEEANTKKASQPKEKRASRQYTNTSAEL